MFGEEESGAGGGEAGGVLEEDVGEEFAVVTVEEKTGTFKGKGAEGGEGSEKSRKEDGEIGFVSWKFRAAEDETKSGRKGTCYVDRQCPPGKVGAKMGDQTHTAPAQKRSGKTGAADQKQHFHFITPFPFLSSS